MWEYQYTDELYHHGIKGQKWGVRRYQNKDGTLTSAGKKRYLEALPTDSAATKRVKKDFNTLSDDEFLRKYKSTKSKYAKRVDHYGDPSNSPLAKFGKTMAKTNYAKKQAERIKKSEYAYSPEGMADKLVKGYAHASPTKTKLSDGSYRVTSKTPMISNIDARGKKFNIYRVDVGVRKDAKRVITEYRQYNDGRVEPKASVYTIYGQK